MDVARSLEAHRSAGRRFSADAVGSFVRDEGDGPAVLCLHGVPVSSYLYRKVVGALAAQGLRGLAIDLPGLGLAERPHSFDYSWSGLGRWAVAAVDALDLDRFHLVVHDIGGPVGFEVISALGARVASLTMLNTVADPANFTPPPVMRPFTVPLVDRLWLHATPTFAFVWLMRSLGVADAGASSYAELAVHRRLLTLRDGGRAFLRIMHSFERTAAKSAQYRDAIRSVAHRQIIWGDRDPTLRYDRDGRAAVAIADLDDVIRLPAKHFLQEDQAPRIAALVADLVARTAT